MSLFSLHGLRQEYGDRVVLDIAALELDRKINYALLGPNGSGKSTLLRILAFLQQPTAGELYFDGQRVHWQEKTLHKLRRRVVLIDQQPIMFTATVLENVSYGLRLRGVPKRRRNAVAESCLDLVGMLPFAPRMAHLLSGGETQRVAIARALACSPDVLLCDEPTASVDVENQSVIEAVIRLIKQERGISVIFATHRQTEAARLADRRIYLDSGSVTTAGNDNVYYGTIIRKEHRFVCRIGPVLEVDTPIDIAGPVRVIIKRKGISLAPVSDLEREPGTNGCRGRVQQITVEGALLHLLLDAGVPIKTSVSKEEARRLGIIAGDDMFITVVPEALHIIR